MPDMRPATVAAALCAAEVLDLLGFATFQALVPFFSQAWGLSNAEAGWISGIYLIGYVAAVPVLVALTDRIDARLVFAAASALAGLAALGFALSADGFVSALAWRAVSGIALAGIYMPGLKALSDRTAGSRQSRFVSFYTASFGLGVAASYVLAGWIADALGWRWAFGLNALGAAAAIAVVLILVPPVRPERHAEATPLLDFRPVLRNRRVLAFILGYFGHSWELFAFRAWIVAYLASAGYAAATLIASIATFLGVASSILGNELSVRIGRLRAIGILAGLSVAISAVVGFGADWPPWLLVSLVLGYGILIAADSAALTAGTVEAAEPGRGGATLAAHAFLGFSGGALGPPAVGLVLDAVGSYGIGFIAMGAGSALTLCAAVLAGRAGRLSSQAD